MRSGILGCLMGAAALLAGCGENGSTMPVSVVANAAPPAKPPLASDPAEATMTVSGPIIVEHEVEVAAQRDGVLEKVFYDAPARVKAGTMLAQLDGRQIEANLEAARAKTRSIAADLKNWQSEAEVLKADQGRAQQLWDLGLISQEQLQHAKYKSESDQYDIQRVQENLNTSRQEERSLELELEKTKIIAPFDGLIARRYVRQGQTIGKGERLFWVTAEGPLMMRFTLPEKLFGKLHPSQTLEITSPDAPREEHTARVKEISPVIDPSSGTFEVLVELIGDRGALRPGMTTSVRLDNPR